MNKKFMLLALALLPLMCAATLNAAKKSVVWDNVAHLYNQRRVIDVTKVVFSDTATTLFAKIEYDPDGKIRIGKKASICDIEGNKYTMKSAEGIVPGKWTAMPSSGVLDIVLNFEPMPKGTEQLDFIEGESENDWKIFGIHNAKKPLTTGVPKGAKDIKKGGNEVLPATKYSPGKSVIRCKVYGHRPIMKTSMSGSYSLISSKSQQEINVPLNNDGTAVIEIEPECPVMVDIGIEGINFVRLAVVPGEDISFSMDMSDGAIFDITGTLPRTQQEINDEALRQKAMKYDYNKAIVKNLKGKTEKEIWAFLDNALRSQKEFFNSLDITDAAKDIFRMDAEEEYLQWRQNFERRWFLANMEASGTKIRTEEEFKKFCDLIKMDYPKYDPKTLPELECLESESALFSNVLCHCYRLRVESDIKNDYNRQLAMIATNIRAEGIVYGDINTLVTAPELKQLLANIAEKERKIAAEMDKSGNIFYKKYDDVAPADILSTILKKHEGKAVFVDIWATWCGPCRRGHEQMKPLKEEMKGKDVVFVYITSPSSPIDKWKQMIDLIPGEHYYLTYEQYSHILNTYESDGIPTYLLFDRKGNLSFKKIGGAANSIFKAEIEKAMK